jgi:dihydropteroate synthase
VGGLLRQSLALAREAGIEPALIAVDPGIGFFRNQLIPWHQWDCDVLAKLSRLRSLGHPICVGVSRKSFIGAIAGADDPQQRLPGSLAATASAVMAGAHLIRAHDVEETVQAVRVAEAIRRAVGDA